MAREKPRNRTWILLPFLLTLFALFILLFQFGERWLRYILIYLSHATWARQLVSNVPVAQTLSRRFVAGESMEEAMAAARALNARGMLVTLDYLGESVTDTGEAVSSREEIVKLLEHIEKTGVDANVSVKLTQLGLRISQDLALDNMRHILAQAKRFNNKVRIDMEESELVDSTLEIYRTLRDSDGFANVGVVIQAYLYRSEKDVNQLVEEGAWVRLCKGAYAEPPEIAFPHKTETDANFVRLTEMMLGDKARAKGVYLGVATHDKNMIDAVIDYALENNISNELFEFQMLYGIRRDLQEWLIENGYRLRIYVPYGTAWYPYTVRRLAERPANLWFFISNLARH